MGKNRFVEELRELIVSSGLSHSFDHGKSHVKIVVCGRLVGICPKHNARNTQRAERNVRSQVRRAIREELAKRRR